MAFHFMVPHIKKLIDHGHKVSLACVNLPNYDELLRQALSGKYETPIHYVDLSRNPLRVKNLNGYFDLKKIIQSGEFDIISTNEPIMGVVTRLAARKSRNKVIYTAHGFHFYKGAPMTNWLLYYPIEKFMSRYTDIIVTINQEDFQRAKTFHAKKVCYIPGIGFDTTKYLNVSEGRIKKRQELGVPAESFVIISVGELGKRKNHEVIIRAIAECQKKDIVYLLCGEGKLRQELQDLADRLNISEQVYFLGYRRDIPELCGCADVIAHPSRREGLGIAPLEGMASGLPLICSYINGIKDYAEEGKTGSCIINPEDTKGFSEAILKYYYNRDLINTIGKYNKEHVKKYDVENVKTILYEIYTERV